MHTKETLIAFEKRVEQAFLDKRIAAPVHLSGNNEDDLIEIFKDVRPDDRVFSTWRSHYHALLKGIPEEWVFSEILAGRSMYLMNREHRFFSSAIVGGALPIALGVAMAIKRNGGGASVWVFVGDMAARTGLFHEFREYARGHSLPVRIVVEDNGLSTNTVTADVWGQDKWRDTCPLLETWYDYERTYPHVGCGKHVTF